MHSRLLVTINNIEHFNYRINVIDTPEIDSLDVSSYLYKNKLFKIMHGNIQFFKYMSIMVVINIEYGYKFQKYS